VNDWKRIQPALSLARKNPGRSVTLAELASHMAQSPFHAHRTLRAALGETPRQFTLRLRIDRAAAALLASRASILDIALECGFESHEVFCRAFRRRFGLTPSAYRKCGLTPSTALRHANWVNQIGPCVGLYHVGSGERLSHKSMDYTIARQDLTPQPILVVRRRVRRADIAATIGAALPSVFIHAQQRGLAIAGYPITRYLESSVGLVTFETGMRVTPQNGNWTAADGQGQGDVLAETLPGGPAAVTIHSGPYEQLQNAYAAVEEWIAANGLQPTGPPWEAYLNDPADHPNPQDWKTQVHWPIQP
jgi:AraC family transcriptional regulator